MNAYRQLPTVALAAAIAVSTACGAVAQTSAKKASAETAKVAEPAPPAVAQPSNAPFMKPLTRLATILGSVSFLRQLCGDGNAPVFRARMDELINLQSPNPADREILVAGYNSGYRSFASVYRRCTPAARMAAARYQDEGAALSRDIATKHGN